MKNAFTHEAAPCLSIRTAHCFRSEMSSVQPSLSIPSTSHLEEVGLYNVLTHIAKGQSDVDPFLLTTLREKGLVSFESAELTDSGWEALQALTVQLGWFYPDE